MTRQQKIVLVVSILASFVTFLDGSIINLALPAIDSQLGGGLQGQQWVVDAYLITLGSLILLAGSLSDLFGRKKILAYGLIGFATASILCAVAPNITLLIIARGLQGIAGALLVPSSLALIISTFSGTAQGKAIGTWTAWTGLAFIVGPLLGGFMVDVSSWRMIFAINVLPIAICLWLLNKIEQTERTKKVKVDYIGAMLCSLGLAGTVYALIEQTHYGWRSPLIFVPFVAGIVMLIVFIWYEGRTKSPILPLSLFRVRNFWVGNVATAAIYAGLSVATFLIAIYLQQVAHYSALLAGLALLPVTIIMFFLSPRFGALASKHGPRFFMAAGPIVAGIGFLVMLRVQASLDYWSQLFPGVIVFALGLAMTVAPLTSAILADVNTKFAGTASAVNNAVARIAGLMAIAAVGVIVGSQLDLAGFRSSMLYTALLMFVGGLVSAAGIQNPSNSKK